MSLRETPRIGDYIRYKGRKGDEFPGGRITEGEVYEVVDYDAYFGVAVFIDDSGENGVRSRLWPGEFANFELVRNSERKIGRDDIIANLTQRVTELEKEAEKLRACSRMHNDDIILLDERTWCCKCKCE